MNTHALIRIDIQRDFCLGGSLAVLDADQIVAPINDLTRDAKDIGYLVVDTRDWHNPGQISFAKNHAGAQPFTKIPTPDGRDLQDLWPIHCVAGSYGAGPHGRLDTSMTDLIISKGTRDEVDSYSAFRDNAKEATTGLGAFLKARGITHVTLVGLAFDYCVGFSALDAVEEGFNVTVIENLCRGITPATVDAMRQRLLDAGVSIELYNRYQTL